MSMRVGDYNTSRKKSRKSKQENVSRIGGHNIHVTSPQTDLLDSI